MEFNIYHESSVWRDARRKRVITFVRAGAYILITVGTIWLTITSFNHMYPLIFTNFITVTLGIIALYLTWKNRISLSKIILLFTATFYVLFLSITTSYSPVVNNGTSHYWFIVLSIIAFFLLYDFKPVIRDSIPLFLIFLFLLFHFNWGPFYPLIILPPESFVFFCILDLTIAMLTFFFITRLFVLEITKAEEAVSVSADRLEGLIESMLPKTIIERMRRDGKTFADEFHDCSVLFADIVGFTTWSEKHSPNEVVDHLNAIFSKFDDAVDTMKLTKIKSSGDSYMVASGIPEFRHDHAVSLINLALELQTIAVAYDDFKFRIGINSGSVVAGIIGKKVFLYDIWGDTVNTASRLETSCEVGKINISKSTYELVKDNFTCTYRGKIEAKNKGMIDMYFVDSII